MSNSAIEAVNIMERIRDRSRAIGGILVERGRLSAGNVDEIQRFAVEHGLRFGEAAVRLDLLTQDDIDSAVAQQFNYPILACGGESGVAEDVVAAYQPQSEIVEPLRALRMIHYSAWLARRWDDPAFPKAFPWFAEPRYWEEHYRALEDQLAAVQGPPLEL